ncbi:protein NEOXANTHIN-DEFICIENT 1-like isoform X1 [Populus alba x Populus x berolinensis]|uniref:Protein NEOXANTHIN-DEFICIENT 1-like isoform X1 n=1 Tax=Populus alba x Populus x berolinensis TaxID=444605 RepID=A0AAD6RJF5_9ROSI|nr:protein NEOXANTHIN-DEFICIENT 1-like isoform X1 [Populus alba x Populus x berolinensis]
MVALSVSEVMADEKTKCSLGYGKPPWIFKGRALYQLHLVKSKIARASIPKEFRLVEAFGYTLGGFFLASYEDSPAGVFDELVVIAGIVWNPPTSCAWAARVLVSSGDACDHGRKDVGLPSQVAKFSKKITAIPRQRKSKFNGFLDMIGLGTASSSTKDCMDVLVTETNGPSATDICNIKLTTSVPGVKFDKWKGPAIKMSLPSFSGRTEYNPNLLKYSCSIECRVRAVQAAKVSGPSSPPKHDTEESQSQLKLKTVEPSSRELLDEGQNLSISVMLSRPILALELSCLKMQVEAPVVVSQHSKSRFN